MTLHSTSDAGNLSKAGPRTRRWMVAFERTKNGHTETNERHAWHARAREMAILRVKNHHEKKGFVCTMQGAVEIPNSYKVP